MPGPAGRRPLQARVRRWWRRRRTKRFRFVFVVTYGRSGSTLVQGLLNTLPRTLVRGENGLYPLGLYRALEQLQVVRRRHLKHNPRASHSAFFGLHEITPASFVQSTRALVAGHLLGSVPPREVDVLGFKEVTWHQVAPDETEGFFAYLDRVFPGCRYVLNTRDPEAAIGSGFWQARDRAETVAAIERTLEVQEFLRRTRPDRVLETRYELITSDDPATVDGQLRALAEFVHGSCDDELLAKMRETLATGHGPFPFGKSRKRKAAKGEGRNRT